VALQHDFTPRTGAAGPRHLQCLAAFDRQAVAALHPAEVVPGGAVVLVSLHGHRAVIRHVQAVVMTGAHPPVVINPQRLVIAHRHAPVMSHGEGLVVPDANPLVAANGLGVVHLYVRGAVRVKTHPHAAVCPPGTHLVASQVLD
ncbi:hypothetical protein KXS13_23120, partial [Yokenella regensburgei]